MTRRTFLWLAALSLAFPAWTASPVRERRNFDADWRFHLGDVNGGEKAALDDAAWRKLNLPHDWSIEGPYNETNASGAGYLPGGIAWYRKTFRLPESLRGHRIVIEFDGMYHNSDAWINGHHLGRRPSGYASVEYDLTPHLNLGTEPNLLAVRLDHSDAADSRFYTGSGIYRHVWLTVTQPVHVAHWGTYVRTPVVREAEALVSIETAVVNESSTTAPVRVRTIIQDAAGREVASLTDQEQVAASQTHTFAQQGRVEKPMLWSPGHPNLYTALTQVYASGVLSDEYRTPFGVRSLRFDPAAGFFLNGTPLKFKGVCLHHELGALGAAAFDAAVERRLKLLKEVGTNAVRASHNPMSPEFYDLCDRLGLLVMDEAFDEWTAGKRKWAQGWNVGTAGTRGYHEAFEEWSTRDLEDMVRRDRNHPSVAMWSIGNEIDYPGDPFKYPAGGEALQPGTPSANILPLIARRLLATVKALDLTRPVTQALADIDASNATGLASMLDVTGYNYLEQFYDRDHQTYPDRVILGSENFRAPAAWRDVATKPYVLGQFLWTGFDYLGEGAAYPHRGSQSGLFDYAGFRKPEAYIRQAMWSDQPMIWAAVFEGDPEPGSQPEGAPAFPGRRLAAHWNWAAAGAQALPVEAYTNCESAELFLNGRSLGEKTVADRYPPVLRWEVSYEPGTLTVVGKRGGKEAARFELATAGEPDRIELVPDKAALGATGSDLSHIEVRVVDAHGQRVPGAQQLIEFEASGAGVLAAVDNGNPRELSSYQAQSRKAWQGRALAIVRSGTQPGRIVVRASSKGLKPAELALTVE